MTNIYLEVDGKPVPAKDVVWLQIAPCGCISGVTSINSFEIFTDGEAAFHRDDPKPIRERQQRLGFTYQAVTTEQYKTVHADRFKQHCSHNPQWGIDPIPVPAGWTWMTTDPYGGRLSHRKHIVPSGSETYRAGIKPTALCGKQDSMWSNQDRHLFDTAECRKCEQRARDTSPVLIEVAS